MNHTSKKSLALASAVAGTFGLLALASHLLSRKAVRDHPPHGQFVEINGVRLHYVSRGQGPTLVLLHGNGSMVEDFECSGLMDLCASRYRVIAFDRPGYGHSPRGSKAGSSPETQADLIAAALLHLGITQAVVLGHSWGTLVALQLALRHKDQVTGLLLESGYYFPTFRADVVMASLGAVPGLGALLSYTVMPFLARLSWRLSVRNLFMPADVPKKFEGFPRELALRPSQLRTSAEEAALMVPSTRGLAQKCARLSIPVALVCGAGDQLIDPHQSARLARRIEGATTTTLLFNGHMVHQTSTPQVAEVLAEIFHRAAEADLPQAS